MFGSMTINSVGEPFMDNNFETESEYKAVFLLINHFFTRFLVILTLAYPLHVVASSGYDDDSPTSRSTAPLFVVKGSDYSGADYDVLRGDTQPLLLNEPSSDYDADFDDGSIVDNGVRVMTDSADGEFKAFARIITNKCTEDTKPNSVIRVSAVVLGALNPPYIVNLTSAFFMEKLGTSTGLQVLAYSAGVVAAVPYGILTFKKFKSSLVSLKLKDYEDVIALKTRNGLVYWPTCIVLSSVPGFFTNQLFHKYIEDWSLVFAVPSFIGGVFLFKFTMEDLWENLFIKIQSMHWIPG